MKGIQLFHAKSTIRFSLIPYLAAMLLWLSATPALAEIYIDEDGICHEVLPPEPVLMDPPDDGALLDDAPPLVDAPTPLERPDFCEISVYMKKIDILEYPWGYPDWDMSVRGKVDGQTKTWNGYIATAVNPSKSTNLLVGKVEIQEGLEETIQVCTRIKEYDDLSGTDGGRLCQDVVVSCDMAPIKAMKMDVDTCKNNMPPVGGDCPTYYNGSARVTYRISNGDADFDGVADEDDAFPDPGDECEMGSAGRGLVVYFHYGDGAVATFGQTLATNFSEIMWGYDYVVFVADKDGAGLETGTLIADRTFPPTEDGFADAIIDVAQGGYDITILTYAHGSYLDTGESLEFGYQEAVVGKISSLGGTRISELELRERLDGDVRGHSGTLPLRAVHGVTTCYFAKWANTWKAFGAKVIGGTSGIQFFPTDLADFISEWNSGTPFADAVRSAQTMSHRPASYLYHKALYFGWRSEDGGVLGALVGGGGCGNMPFLYLLGLTAEAPCFVDFMNDTYGTNLSDWDGDWSGAENFEIHSTREITGVDQGTYAYTGPIDYPGPLPASDGELGTLPCADAGIEDQLCIDKFTPLTWY